MKDELKNREMHMELLRKKISQLEEKNRSRNNLALDRDDAIVTVQRLHRKVERLQHALGDERVKVGQLKAELAEIHQLKVCFFLAQISISNCVPINVRFYTRYPKCVSCTSSIGLPRCKRNTLLWVNRLEIVLQKRKLNSNE